MQTPLLGFEVNVFQRYNLVDKQGDVVDADVCEL